MMSQEKSKNETPYGKISLKQLEEAVKYIFKDNPKKKVKEKDKKQPYLSVQETEDTLSFKLVNSGTPFLTGLGGFINMFNQEGGSLIVMYPVVLNGQLLGEEETEVFWEKFAKIKERYENKS